MKKNTKEPRIVVLGGINTDYLVRCDALPEPGQTVPGTSFYTGPGGKGANQAVAAVRLGARVALIGRVGGDERGRELIAGLRQNHINVSKITADQNGQTGAAIIGVDKSGEKQICAALGANMRVTVRQIDDAEALIADADVLLMQLEVPMPAIMRAAALAKRQGVKVILDPAPPTALPKKLFPLLHVIRPNRDEAEQITGRNVRSLIQARSAARFLLQKGVKVVAMEAGSEGDLIISETEEILLPRLKVKTVDATGAGDAFAGGFAVGIAERLTLSQAARLANATAALATTKVGAQEALPTRSAVERLLRSPPE